MHLGDPSGLETTSSSAVGEAMMDVTAAHEGINGGGGGGEIMDTNLGDDEKRNNGGGGEEGDKMNCGGNRWPRQETFALLKIRSDMDAAFRDSSLKGPLWEEISRKLGELGYHRSAKKCKEKFENVYKYHKRTKESRSGKPEGKTYKFFDQLQALENHQFTLSSHAPTPTSKPPQPSSSLPTNTTTLLQSTRPSIDVSETTISYVPPAAAIPSTNPTLISPPPPPTNPRNVLQQGSTVPYSLPNMNLVSTTSTSSSTASDEDMEARYRKKRKWKEYFRRLTRQVLAEQEEMQKRFLEAIDKRERERVAQQEAWRIQEMARINREHDILVQERSTAAAKDAAVIAFLQKLSGQTPPPPPPPPLAPQPSPPPPQVQSQQLQLQQQLQQPPLLSSNNNFEIQKMTNGSGHGQSGSPMSSSRWPKAEVHALIRLRTTLDAKYQENGPKGPLWEDISAGLQRLGYNRSAKRCKEKWENINKYFKKVKESSKQRREDSKTCPYFHELEVLYKEKSKTHNPVGSSFYNSTTKQPNEMMEPLMVQPEQQWRPPPPVMEEQVKEREGGIEEEEEEDIDDVEEDGDSVEDEERYEVATNKLSSVDTVE